MRPRPAAAVAGAPAAATTAVAAGGPAVLGVAQGPASAPAPELVPVPSAVAPLRPVRALAEDDDLLRLEDFDDRTLLRCLKARYERSEIYTWVGSVLVSVNPYREVGAFSEALAVRYADPLNLPAAPHLFAIVAGALAVPGGNHALLISGESGAGKTEAARAALAFLARRCGAAERVRDRLLHSNPVLEAFGNARTRQNGNSSRFGKLIEVHISRTGRVVGGTLKPYMLEASRVSGTLPEAEGTYHVFYQLRAALYAVATGSTPHGPLWATLTHANAWQSLARIAGPALAASKRLAGGPSEVDCLAAFENLYERLLGTGMSHGHVAECARVVAAVAILADEAVSSEVLGATMEELMGTPQDQLRWFFTHVETTVGGTGRERLVRTRGEHEARTLRATLAQELYAALFLWVTRLVGSGIAPPPEPGGGKRLGLLDLYGFEIFPSNGFEQLLINYCNERIQQLFNRQVFLSEAEDYTAEGLDRDGHWHSLVQSACRLPALALLQGEPGGFAGIFGVMSDRSRCGFDANASGECSGGEVAEAIAAACGGHPAFRRSPRDAGRLFGVAHFAGDVFYDTRHFVNKNAGAHRPDIVAFLRQHGGSFVRSLFTTDPAVEGGGAAEGPLQPAPGRGRLLGSTLISAFRAELNELCETLEARECRHIRCLRPNDSQVPLAFDATAMLRQCRYSGLLEATRIRRYGYAHRRSLGVFAQRYAAIVEMARTGPSAGLRRPAKLTTGTAAGAGTSTAGADAATACASICEAIKAAGIDPSEVCMGKTKVFLREGALKWLEERRHQLAAERLSAWARACIVRCWMRRLRTAVVCLQAHVRGHLARQELRRQQAEAFVLAQQALEEGRTRALEEEAAVTALQRWWRRSLSCSLGQEPEAVTTCSDETVATPEDWKAKRRAAWVSPCGAPHALTPEAAATAPAVARSPRGAPSIGTKRPREHERPSRPAAPVSVRRSLRAVPGKENEVPRASVGAGGGPRKGASVQLSPRNQSTHVAGPRRPSPIDIVQGTGAGTSAAGGSSERLIQRLLRVGRALRDRQITPEKAELLEGLLDSLMPPGEGSEEEMLGSAVASGSQLSSTLAYPSSCCGGNDQRLPPPPMATLQTTPSYQQLLQGTIATASVSTTARPSPPPTPQTVLRQIAVVVTASGKPVPPMTPPMNSRRTVGAGSPPLPPGAAAAVAAAAAAGAASGSRGPRSRREASPYKQALKGPVQDQVHSARGPRGPSPAGRSIPLPRPALSGSSTPRPSASGNHTPRTIPETGGTNSACMPNSGTGSPRGYQVFRPAFRTGLPCGRNASHVKTGN